MIARRLSRCVCKNRVLIGGLVVRPELNGPGWTSASTFQHSVRMRSSQKKRLALVERDVFGYEHWHGSANRRQGELNRSPRQPAASAAPTMCRAAHRAQLRPKARAAPSELGGGRYTIFASNTSTAIEGGAGPAKASTSARKLKERCMSRALDLKYSGMIDIGPQRCHVPGDAGGQRFTHEEAGRRASTAAGAKVFESRAHQRRAAGRHPQPRVAGLRRGLAKFLPGLVLEDNCESSAREIDSQAFSSEKRLSRVPRSRWTASRCRRSTAHILSSRRRPDRNRATSTSAAP